MATPLDDLKARVSGLKVQVVRLQQESAPVGPATAPGVLDVIAEEAAAAIGGAFTSDLFGRRGVGSRAGRALVRQQRSIQQHQAMQTRRMAALSIVDQLRTEIESRRGQLDNRFLTGLSRALAGAANAQRPDTILRKAAEISDRLLGYAPPSGPSEDYLLLKRLEEDFGITS